ncbi:hypothetical protein JKP88DRAFT_266902 [Tribonema minus]|uniref:WW domain-containing protein n=1 Tax=Tribonema minus TaxID=303371 RepID=A0A835ZCL8_9STRA|nr:hypothetical protein JKP88DRAFT_266902 [Tribonema minus]
MAWADEAALTQMTMDLLQNLFSCTDLGEIITRASTCCDPTRYTKPCAAQSESSSSAKVVGERWLEIQQTLPARIMGLRRKADDLACKGFYQQAVRRYTAALRLCKHWVDEEPSQRASLHHNRAAALVAQGLYEEALHDCEAASVLECNWVKPYYIKAAALQGMGRRCEALRLFAFLARARPDARIELPCGATLGAHAHASPPPPGAVVLRREDLLAVCAAPPGTPDATLLPAGWVARESRLRPGLWFFEHVETELRQWTPPPLPPSADARLISAAAAVPMAVDAAAARQQRLAAS